MGWLWNMIFGWEEILVTQDIDKYMQVKNDLNSKGIISKTEFVNNPSSNKGIGPILNTTMYYLYVKKDKRGKNNS
jgi:hypothetical protein